MEELEVILKDINGAKLDKMDALKFSDAITTKMIKHPKGVFKQGGITSNPNLKTIVGNTYNWLDSHGDVHVKSCFKTSLEENKQVFHLHDHEYKISSQVGEVQKVEERDVKWSDLGIEKDGSTQCLVMESDVSKTLSPEVSKLYMENKINQHSVGMKYVDLDLAVNSTDKDYKKEKAVWDEYIEKIGNKEKAEEKNYFWVVKEAILIEISCVLKGSNELTPTLEEKAAQDSDADIQLIRNTLNFI